MHPFLDVNKLTDEEIIERLGKAYSYMNYQSSLGHNSATHSIKEIIQSLEDERNDRMGKRVDDEFKRKYPNDLAPIELGKLEENIRKLI
jgi:hypothetical protein